MGENLVVQGNYGVINFEEYAMSVDSVVKQIELIQTVMKKVMKDGEHYGVIPGCGSKPSLLKPGAEKLGVTFRLAPSYKITEQNLPHEHRGYEVVTTLTHIPTGQVVGEGVGYCSTMEGKYRYRTGEVELTGKPVPQEYWKERDIKLLGGRGFVSKKNPDTGKWEIARQGEKVEHDNPADYYNTCLKMSKKRSQVDAILTATAASDIFTQDIEDMQHEATVTKTEDKMVQPTVEDKKKEMAAWFEDTYGDKALAEFERMTDGKIKNPLTIKNETNVNLAYEKYLALRKKESETVETVEGEVVA